MNITRERIFKLLHERHALQRYIARRWLFSLFEKMGFHIVGDHFYEPIPNLSQLKIGYPDAGPSLPIGTTVDFQEIEQRHIDRIAKYQGEFEQNVGEIGYRAQNYYFRFFDGISLYCFLRDNKIRKIVEIGQGSSTLVSLAALKKNAAETRQESLLISIDPYDRLSSQGIEKHAVGVSVHRKQIQNMDSNHVLSMMDERTLLFVDSSHVFKANSDVEYLMRHIYPLIPTGSFLHIHDIYTPYPWPLQNLLERKWFWNEQEHLESFLAFNSAFRIVLPVYWLYKESRRVREMISALSQGLVEPGFSFYMQRT